MIRQLVNVVVLLLIVLIGGAYLQPRNVHVERTVLVDRPPEVVFPLLNSLHRFNEWSPWQTYDPQMRMSYSGPESGVGARMEWAGNSKVGHGSQEITVSEKDSRVASTIEFGDQGPAQATFKLTPIAGQTQVSWSLDVDMGNNPIGRYMGLLMDRNVGPDYERGLEALKALAEKTPAPAAATTGQPESAPVTTSNAPTS